MVLLDSLCPIGHIGARHLMLIDICITFREYSTSSFQVIEWTRFVTDRQRDRQQDAWGKTIMSLDPEGCGGYCMLTHVE